MSEFSLTAKICLTKIPKDKIFTSEKTGHKYIDIQISQMRQEQFGNTHSIYIYDKTKPEGERRIFIGDAKPPPWANKSEGGNPQSDTADAPIVIDDDLPF